MQQFVLIIADMVAVQSRSALVDGRPGIVYSVVAVDSNEPLIVRSYPEDADPTICAVVDEVCGDPALKPYLEAVKIPQT